MLGRRQVSLGAALGRSRTRIVPRASTTATRVSLLHSAVGHMPESTDVAIVGSGLAGMCAAVAAAEAGTRSVTVLERAHGGGASALSGGIVYAGGGTAQQREAGFEDSPADMLAYMRAEVGDSGVVDDATLRRFCDGSAADIRWLEGLGAGFSGSTFCKYKTSYPKDGDFLYYSGNEKAARFAAVARPAPRGHRTVGGPGMTGIALWRAVFDAATKKGVRFEAATKVEDIVMDQGRAVGVKYRRLNPVATAAPFAKHKKLSQRALDLRLATNKLADWYDKRALGVFQRHAEEGMLGAGTVILAAGGFGLNHALVKSHYPLADRLHFLGTAGDDGAGIQLGLAAGGSTGRMDSVSAWRFLYPPDALLHGVAVGPDGTRIAAEDLYGAAFTDRMVRRHGGRGFLVLDSDQWARATAQVAEQTQSQTRLVALYVNRWLRRKADSLGALAGKVGVDAGALADTVAAYNNAIIAGEPDPVGKTDENRSLIARPPFYVVDVSLTPSGPYMSTGITLGGLRVEGGTGLVLRESAGGDKDRAVVPGLYAAGRTAVGLCSNGYVSGLSLADCVFSGRRAGEHAARSVLGNK
ncbi:hypothetical protein RB595_005684 [Gaeumannomyces hyphopodioides]